MRVFRLPRGAKNRVALGAALGTAVLLAGFALAPMASGRIIWVCVKQVGGSVHVVSAGTKCKTGEVRSAGAVTTITSPTFASDPLNGATWTQHPRELDQLVGQVTVTTPPA